MKITVLKALKAAYNSAVARADVDEAAAASGSAFSGHGLHDVLHLGRGRRHVRQTNFPEGGSYEGETDQAQRDGRTA